MCERVSHTPTSTATVLDWNFASSVTTLWSFFATSEDLHLSLGEHSLCVMVAFVLTAKHILSILRFYLCARRWSPLPTQQLFSCSRSSRGVFRHGSWTRRQTRVLDMVTLNKRFKSKNFSWVIPVLLHNCFIYIHPNVVTNTSVEATICSFKIVETHSKKGNDFFLFYFPQKVWSI